MVSFTQIRQANELLFTENCPTRAVLDHVMSKWGVLVLLALTDGVVRWGELRRSVEGISEKMLASTLKTLEADGFVERTAYPEVPPRVDYRLTPLGEELMERMGPLVEWIAVRADDIVPKARLERSPLPR
jgi:DNA-binding HxlR family transcriptional regulator